MNIILFLIIFILIVVGIAWSIGVWITNDFSVPTRSLENYRSILLVFPHPDDETFSAGGLTKVFTKHGGIVTSLILTKGERGTPDAHLDPQLSIIRTDEASKVADILGVTHHIHENFGDGLLPKKKAQLVEYVGKAIKKFHPDLIITFDRSGIYGHPDHIVCSEVVSEAVKKSGKHIDLWYTTLSHKLLNMISLPEHMAKGPAFKKSRRPPDFTIGIWPHGTIAKTLALYTYKSQFSSFIKGLPFRPIPPWFLFSMELYEHFSEATIDKN